VCRVHNLRRGLCVSTISTCFFSRLSRVGIKFIDSMNRIHTVYPRNTRPYDYVIDETSSSD